MNLTSQPLSDHPGLKDLAAHLYENVGKQERWGCGVSGAILLLRASRMSGLAKLGALVAGGSLVVRALSGHCPLYKMMDMDTNDAGAPQGAEPAPEPKLLG